MDEQGKEHCIFTGDTLFLGDVGRPDLAQKSDTLTTEDLARMLYQSLRDKIMPLPNDVIVYPAHGAGSACGKKMSKETVDTLGNQKKTNYALRSYLTRKEFIKEVTNGLQKPPAYFPDNVKLNKEGYKSIDAILRKSNRPLFANDFANLAFLKDVIILDIRHQHEFETEHIPGSIFIGLNGSFAPWVGAIIKNIHQPILLVADENKVEEAIIRLSRVGFDQVLGYLKGGINAWKKERFKLDYISSISANLVEPLLQKNSFNQIIDVRKKSEFNKGHIRDAINIPLSSFKRKFNLKSGHNIYIHCASGYRSMIAASLLKQKGIHSFINIKNGYQSIKNTNIPLSKSLYKTI